MNFAYEFMSLLQLNKLKMKKMQTIWDRILRSAIRLSMLTGISFVVTACYGPMPPDRDLVYDAEQQLEQVGSQSADTSDTNEEQQ